VERDEEDSPPSVTRRVLRWMEDKIYPGAILAGVTSRRVQFILPHQAHHGGGAGGGGATASLPAVLKWRSTRGRLVREYRVQEWGLAHASLEEVFINIVRQAKAREAKTKETEHMHEE
jgi:hypothetical protein